MKVDPLAPRLLIDYDIYCRLFGPLAFDDFVILWHAADVIKQLELGDDFELDAALDLPLAGASCETSIH